MKGKCGTWQICKNTNSKSRNYRVHVNVSKLPTATIIYMLKTRQYLADFAARKSKKTLKYVDDWTGTKYMNQYVVGWICIKDRSMLRSWTVERLRTDATETTSST
jgi:hypothetical protein